MDTYWIPEFPSGRLAIGPRPMAHVLDIWLDDLTDQGVDHVVSFLSKEEAEEFGLAEEEHFLRDAGIEFTSFPVDDMKAPQGEGFDELITELCALLDGGKSLLLHCAGGVGRSGTAAICLLKCVCKSTKEAIEIVTEARGCAVPESDVQHSFVEAFTPPPRR